MSRIDEEQRDEYRRAQQRKKRRTSDGTTGTARSTSDRRSAGRRQSPNADRRSAEEVQSQKADRRSGERRQSPTSDRRSAEERQKPTTERHTSNGKVKTDAGKRPVNKRKPVENEVRADARRRTRDGEAQSRRKHSAESISRPSSGKRNVAGADRPSSEKKSSGKNVSERQKAQLRENARRRKERNNRISRNIGLIMTAVQTVASIVFMVALFILNMLPNTYLIIIFVLLLFFCGIILASQFFSKKNAVSGKILSGVISLILIIGSYYIFKTTGALSDITGSDYKLDNVVVAVLAEDSAETIEDAAEYTFGVQYQMKGTQIEDTVTAINEELGSDIKTVEFDTIAEQAEALHDGKVDAIIYNEGYTGILEEEISGFATNTKVIYEHSIKSELVNLAANVSVDEEPFSVYISGIDVYGAIETNSRSDVNMIATVNPKTHQILLVTTPRDYYVEFPGITGGQKDKLTHAGVHGVDVSMATLEELYDTELDFYARVNFTSLIEIVDALGGIDVESEYAFTTSEESGLVMDVQEGTNHFNGKEALAFCRERKNILGGDNQRGKNQQAVITAMIQKMVSPAILMGANDIIESVSGNIDTNMSMEQLQDLIKAQLKKSPSWDIKSLAAEGTADSLYCYSYSGGPLYVTVPDDESVNTIIEAINAVEDGEIQEDTVSTEGN